MIPNKQVDLSYYPEPLRQQMAVVNDPEWQAQRQALWERDYSERFAESYGRRDYKKIYNYFMTGEGLGEFKWDLFLISLDFFPIMTIDSIGFFLEKSSKDEVSGWNSKTFIYSLAYRLMAMQWDGVNYIALDNDEAALKIFDWFWGEEFKAVSEIPHPVGQQEPLIFWEHSLPKLADYILSTFKKYLEGALDAPKDLPWLKRLSFVKTVFSQLDETYFSIDDCQATGCVELEIQPKIWALLLDNYHTASGVLPQRLAKLNQEREQIIREVLTPLRTNKPRLAETMDSITADCIAKESTVYIAFSLPDERASEWRNISREIFVREFKGEYLSFFDDKNIWMPEHTFPINISALLDVYAAEKKPDWMRLLEEYPEVERSGFQIEKSGGKTIFLVSLNTIHPERVELGLRDVFSGLGVSALESWYRLAI
ncbi:hypothetical protein EZV61_09605 [Corallincola luteus]|uniref:Uncharacterized protein n=1 Tax=Corallincola luteus TaxID=1775177 RepID=A0ABY2ANU5_9GAMM|nr:hypothetical protein [Corallincola luteus]TCI03139.1 hypothetical protein EZV61_09605 [Corallincola luteus]